MIYVLPAATNHETSYGITNQKQAENPSLVALVTCVWNTCMNKWSSDPAVKLKLAGSYAGIANYRFWRGNQTAHQIQHPAAERGFENSLQIRAKGKSEYQYIMSDYAKKLPAATWTPLQQNHALYLNERCFHSPLAAFAASSFFYWKTAQGGSHFICWFKENTDAASVQLPLVFLFRVGRPSEWWKKLWQLWPWCNYNDIDKNQHLLLVLQKHENQFWQPERGRHLKLGKICFCKRCSGWCKNAFVEKPAVYLTKRCPLLHLVPGS